MPVDKIKISSQYGKWRALSLIAVHLLIGLHIAHWLVAGRTLAPLELNEVVYTIHLGIVTAGFLFMLTIIIGTIFFGRFFCSWACHMLALQDLSAWVLRKFNIRPIAIRSRALVIIPFIIMGYLFIWPQAKRLWLGQSLPALRIATDMEGWASFITDDFWRNLPGPFITLLTFFVCGFIIIWFLGSRSFCRFACPWGAVFSLADRVAPGRITLSGNCIECGMCTAVCDSNIRVQEEVNKHGMVVNADCLKDMDCVEVCPVQVLRFSYTKPPLLKGIFTGIKSNYSFSIGEDIALLALFLPLFMIFRDLYDAIPILLAAAIALIMSGFMVVFARLFREREVKVSLHQLKKNNMVTAAGKIFSITMILFLIFTVHSGFIQYHNTIGQQAFDVAASALNNDFSETAESSRQTASAGDALKHLEKTYQRGLFRSVSLRRKLAILYLVNGSAKQAEEQLRYVLRKNPDDAEARFFLGKLLFNTGRYPEAEDELKAVAGMPDKRSSKRIPKAKSSAHSLLGHIARRQNDRQKAVRLFEAALGINPDDPDALLSLGSLLTEMKRFDEAERYLLISERLMPNSALIHNNLGTVYMYTGDMAKSIYHYEISLRLKPDNYVASFNTGILHYRQGNAEAALAFLNEALRIKPDYAAAREAIARINDAGKNK